MDFQLFRAACGWMLACTRTGGRAGKHTRNPTRAAARPIAGRPAATTVEPQDPLVRRVYATGSVTVTTTPLVPGRFSACALPPCASATRRTMYSPNPR